MPLDTPANRRIGALIRSDGRFRFGFTQELTRIYGCALKAEQRTDEVAALPEPDDAH